MPSGLSIALDGTPLAGPTGGIKRFTDCLVQALRTEFPNDEYALVSDQFLPLPKGLDRRWWSVGLPRALRKRGARVFHGTDFSVPYWGGIPSVMTVHDLSPWRMPSAESARVRRRCGMLLRCRIPTMVHTPSEAVRQELLDYFRFPMDRVRVIPLASVHRPPYVVRPGRYFLYLGTLEERKNLDVVVEAARRLWEAGEKFELVLAGAVRPGYQAPQGAGIVLRGAVDEGELPSLYANALAVVYPSRYEGFGLPVLEALQCGALVFAADIPVLRETGGAAALYAGVADVARWAALMKGALEGTIVAGDSTAQVARFSWRSTAQRMRALYLEAMERG